MRRQALAHRPSARPHLLLVASVIAGTTLLLCLMFAVVVHAAEYTVTNTDPSGPGSLRQAIIDANAAGGPDTIIFTPTLSGIIVLTDTLPEITDTLTISGPGASVLAVSGDNKYRVMEIQSGTAVTITGLTIRDGNVAGEGGGIYSEGKLLLSAVDVVSNMARAGGGLSQKPGLGGALHVAGGLFEGNLATGKPSGDQGGGGIWLRGAAVLSGTWIISNTATHASPPTYGGGLYVQSSVILTNVRVMSNTVQGYGGGLCQGFPGQVRITGGCFAANEAGRYGAGLYIHSRAVLSGTEVVGNAANWHGGGLYQGLSSARVDVTGGRFEGNVVKGPGYRGGGLFVTGSAALTNTVVISNTSRKDSGGGLYVGGRSMLRGTQVVSNTAARFGGGGQFLGDCTVIGCLVERNVAKSYSGGGLHVLGKTVLSGTQVLSNTAGWSGGGVYQDRNDRRVEVMGGSFQGNSAHGTQSSDGGGGLYSAGPLDVTGGCFVGNGAANLGGAVYAGSTVNMTDTLCVNNSAASGGALFGPGGLGQVGRIVNNVFARNTENVLHIGRPGLEIVHTTIASPTVGAGAAIYVDSGGARITDTIVASYTVGISCTAGTNVSEDYNLFFGNTTHRINLATGPHSLVGHPAFVDLRGDDYRLVATMSAAVDRGTDVGVTTDFDGTSRPQGPAFDIGAYEVQAPAPRPVGGATIPPDELALVGHAAGVLVSLTGVLGSGVALAGRRRN